MPTTLLTQDQDWHVCVPDSRFVEATRLFDQLSDTCQRGEQVLPPLRSLLHTYPRFRPKEDNNTKTTMGFYIMPASEDSFIEIKESMIERSKHNVPYPKLEGFAQSLVVTQQWLDLTHLVDGMDLDLEWGHTHLQLGDPSVSEMEYVRSKNNKIVLSLGHSSGVQYCVLQPLSEKPDRTKKWRQIVEGKDSRVPPHLRPNSWRTQFRSKNSGDPRLREGKAV